MTTLNSSQIKEIRSLSEKKFRQQTGLFVVEGEKMVDEALASGFEVVGVYRKDEIGEAAMSRISSLSSPSPVLAVLRQQAWSIPDISSGLYVALDSVRDPGNLGTIIRLCDWFGIDAIFASEDTVELYNPKVVQSTMGAIFRKKVIYCDLKEVCGRFKALGKPVYGTFLDGSNIYAQPLSKDGLIIMGNESNGISDALRACVTDSLLIPSFTGGAPTAESLNVAIATAVTLSEFKRKTL